MTAQKSSELTSSMPNLPPMQSSFWKFLVLLLSIVSIAEPGSVNVGDSDHGIAESYGVDVSWPMQHKIENEKYKNFMNGCYQQGYKNFEKRPDGLYQRKDEKDKEETYDKDYFIACDSAEQDRLDMNLNQPKSVQNYTHAGYAKVHTPLKIINLLKNFWEKNQPYIWPEFWNDGNTFVNHWEAPTSVLDIGRQDLPHSFTTQEYNTIIKSIQDVLESWTNQRLVLTSVYGIRVYGEGAILAPHVDRLPLVSSAIINIFQHNVTEPWVLEVIGHDGMAHNLTAEPRDMILYESASIIHGRPYPLKGEGAMYGSLFVHFEPLYHTLRHAQKSVGHYSSTNLADRNRDAKNAFEAALKEQLKKPKLEDFRRNLQSGRADKDGKTAAGNAGTGAQRGMAFRKTPDYVWPEYDGLYDQRFYFEYNEDVYPKTPKVVFGNLNSHQAASLGELNALKEIAKTQGRGQLFKADHNGWKPLHEAARSGHAHVIEYLLNEGAKVNERTNFDEGGNALFWAQKNPKKNAKAIAVLEKHGGVAVPPVDKNAGKNKEK